MGIRETINSRDGHIYYVIETGKGETALMGIVFLDHYEDLNNVVGKPGLFFVRNAAPDDTGQHGDPTVHQGWAMYTWDNQKKVVDALGGVTWGGWHKVAEQESVDGPWGIDEKILNLFVKKVDFNLIINDLEGRLVVVEKKSTKNEENINNLIELTKWLKARSHKHENMDVLDTCENIGGVFNALGAPVSDGFIYDNIVDDELVWKNPLDDSEPEVVEASFKIAEKFVDTNLAWAGQTLKVMEVSGGSTTFSIIKTFEDGRRKPLTHVSQVKSDRKYYDYSIIPPATEAELRVITAEEAIALLESGAEGHVLTFSEKKLTYVPCSGTELQSKGGVTFTDVLPAESIQNDKRGIWYPMKDDGEFAPNAFYISIEGHWVDILNYSGSGTETGTVGAEFTLAYSDEDPQMPFKKNHLFWKEPDDDMVGEHWWGKTVLVRKYGSAPLSIKDGDVIFETKSRVDGATGFVDTCPYSTEPVYYQLFSTTRGGASYMTNDPVNPSSITWQNMFTAIANGSIDEIVKDGDTIILPKHPIFGSIECEVITVYPPDSGFNGFVVVATKAPLEKMAFGSTNDYETSDLKKWLEDNFNLYTQLKVSPYGKAQVASTATAPAYYTFDGKFIPLVIAAGEDFPEGVTVYEKDTAFPNGLFSKIEIPLEDETIGYDFITKEKHFHHQKATLDWWTRQKNDTKVVTGCNEEGVAPSEQLGAVVVFTIGEKDEI